MIEYMTSWCVFDIAGKEQELTKLESETTRTDFWSDQARAQSVMRKLDALKNMVSTWRELEKKVGDLNEMVNLVIEEEDTSLHDEIRNEIDTVNARLDTLEVQLLLNDEYDTRDAILALHAGAGGVCSCRGTTGDERGYRDTN
jgi:peptide chain release factor 2